MARVMFSRASAVMKQDPNNWKWTATELQEIESKKAFPGFGHLSITADISNLHVRVYERASVQASDDLVLRADYSPASPHSEPPIDVFLLWSRFPEHYDLLKPVADAARAQRQQQHSNNAESAATAPAPAPASASSVVAQSSAPAAASSPLSPAMSQQRTDGAASVSASSSSSSSSSSAVAVSSSSSASTSAAANAGSEATGGTQPDSGARSVQQTWREF